MLKKLAVLTAFAVVVATLLTVAPQPASAGGKCPPGVQDLGVCEAYLRAVEEMTGVRIISKTQVKKASVFVGPALKYEKKKKASGRTICVSVLNNTQDALVLYQGRSQSGKVLKDDFDPKWKSKGNGWMTTVCFPAKLIADKSVVALCDGDGQSVWGRGEIDYLLSHGGTPPGDPACTGGKAWCAKRGL